MKPKKLKIGDTIGIVSASDPITKERSQQLEKGIQVLSDLGFKIVRGKYLSSVNPKERAEDINIFFADKKVKAIICTQGGDSAEKLLSYIDWQKIKENPKIFMGISDITVLLNAIHRKTGLITFHGNDICWGFGRDPTEYDKQEFLNVVVRGTKEIKQNRERKTIRSGKAEGRLMGGNAYSLLKLRDTEFWPDFTDTIICLEEYKPTEEQCVMGLSLLKDLGVFDKIKGVIIGHIDGYKGNPKKQMEDLLLEFTKEYDFPILKVNDFGHNCPNTTLPIGCKIEVDADKKTIKFMEDCVE